MFRLTINCLLATLFAGLCAGAAPAQGIEVNADAVVLSGSAATTTKPATVDWNDLRDRTPEWKTIKSQGVTKDSARYSLLVSQLTKRIKQACQKVAQDKGYDCVVRSGDIADAKGLSVEDLTSRVAKELESEDEDS
jgi:hypothetical protein